MDTLSKQNASGGAERVPGDARTHEVGFVKRTPLMFDVLLGVYPLQNKDPTCVLL